MTDVHDLTTAETQYLDGILRQRDQEEKMFENRLRHLLDVGVSREALGRALADRGRANLAMMLDSSGQKRFWTIGSD